MMSEQKTGRAPARYADAGVDIDAGNELVNLIKPVVKGTRRPGADALIGGFGGMFDLKAAGFEDPILVATTDGVGTKVKIAAETGLHETIGIDLVAMCVNDLVVQGAEPLFFLDYYATGRLDPKAAAVVVAGIAAGCREAGAALIGGETAEMPGVYANNDYDLAGFAVGAAERSRLLPRSDVGPGDVLLGLASSGVHSNGYSLVRRLVADAGLDWDRLAPFAPDTPLGKALITPTRIYVKSILRALKETSGIKALAHITGGGLPENLPRALPDGVDAEIELGSWPRGPLFELIAELATGVDTHELHRMLNMGVGMVLVVAERDVAAVQSSIDESTWIIGRLVGGEPGHRRVHLV